MEKQLDNFTYIKKVTYKTCMANCSNCGVEVEIVLPFAGCIFCDDCWNDNDNNSYSYEA